MKFLDVFRVVLCLHTGVSSLNQNDERDVLHQQHTKNGYFQKDGVILDDNFNSLRDVINKAIGLYKIHSSDRNLKRYMIINPDGTVEHIDKFDMVADKYPNYIELKSTDLEKYAEKSKNKISPISKSLIKEKQSFTNAPISATLSIMKKDKEKDYPETSKNIDRIKPNKPVELQENLANVSLPTNISDTMLKQDLANTVAKRTRILQENSVNSNLNIHLKNSTAVPLNSGKILKDKGKNYKKLPNTNTLPVINVNQDESDNVNFTSSTPSSLIPSLANIDELWFQDREFLDELKNNTHNILYFLFVPPSPQVKKETKITIYPNGTKVEEVIDIVEDEDGTPQALKTTKVTHAVQGA